MADLMYDSSKAACVDLNTDTVVPGDKSCFPQAPSGSGNPVGTYQPYENPVPTSPSITLPSELQEVADSVRDAAGNAMDDLNGAGVVSEVGDMTQGAKQAIDDITQGAEKVAQDVRNSFISLPTNPLSDLSGYIRDKLSFLVSPFTGAAVATGISAGLAEHRYQKLLQPDKEKNSFRKNFSRGYIVNTGKSAVILGGVGIIGGLISAISDKVNGVIEMPGIDFGVDVATVVGIQAVRWGINKILGTKLAKYLLFGFDNIAKTIIDTVANIAATVITISSILSLFNPALASVAIGILLATNFYSALKKSGFDPNIFTKTGRADWKELFNKTIGGGMGNTRNGIMSALKTGGKDLLKGIAGGTIGGIATLGLPTLDALIGTNISSNIGVTEGVVTGTGIALAAFGENPLTRAAGGAAAAYTGAESVIGDQPGGAPLIGNSEAAGVMGAACTLPRSIEKIPEERLFTPRMDKVFSLLEEEEKDDSLGIRKEFEKYVPLCFEDSVTPDIRASNKFLSKEKKGKIDRREYIEELWHKYIQFKLLVDGVNSAKGKKQWKKLEGKSFSDILNDLEEIASRISIKNSESSGIDRVSVWEDPEESKEKTKVLTALLNNKKNTIVDALTPEEVVGIISNPESKFFEEVLKKQKKTIISELEGTDNITLQPEDKRSLSGEELLNMTSEQNQIRILSIVKTNIQMNKRQLSSFKGMIKRSDDINGTTIFAQYVLPENKSSVIETLETENDIESLIETTLTGSQKIEVNNSGLISFSQKNKEIKQWIEKSTGDKNEDGTLSQIQGNMMHGVYNGVGEFMAGKLPFLKN